RPASAQKGAKVEAHDAPAEVTALVGHTVLIGCGRVGRLVAAVLIETKEPFLVIETSETLIAELRPKGVETIIGNAATPDVFAAASRARAKYRIVAIPEAFEAGQAVQQARAANPSIQILARAHSDAEVDHLTRLGADLVIMGEREIARGLIEAFSARRARS